VILVAEMEAAAMAEEVAMAAEAEVTSDARTSSTIDVLAYRNMAF
jgi:hypothetical protein